MSAKSWKEITASGKLSKVVGVFIWEPFSPTTNDNIIVTVSETKNGTYVATPDKAVYPKWAGDPYYTIEEGNTVEEALQNLISAYRIQTRNFENHEEVKIVKWPQKGEI